jgi:hypothetical protein
LNFLFKCKVGHFSSSQNSRWEQNIFLVPENRWQEQFGNGFHKNFGNCRDMMGKLWCLIWTNSCAWADRFWSFFTINLV